MANPLDITRLTMSGFPARVEHHAELSSTQDRARQCAAEQNAVLPLLIVADRQTAGRGRGGNSWWTGEGGLAFSLLFDPAQFGSPWRKDTPLSLAVAVAIVDMVAPRTTRHQIGLHWPNDVYVDDRKLAGILVEVLADGRHIIGIGLNTNNRAADAPPALQSQVATLRDLANHKFDHTELLVDLMDRLAARLRQLAASDPGLGESFDSLCSQHGKTLTLNHGDRSIEGRCIGIGPDGGLILETVEGRRTFYSGMLRPT